MNLRTKIIFFLIAISSLITAQNETTKWYFGQFAALDFMNSPPTLIAGSAMDAAEGSASMADSAGNLLFYTCFDIVYNSQNVPMANGTGMINNISSTQSAIIVKRPGSSSLYYLFQQCGTGLGANTGFRYSVIDMSLAAGMGSVTTKNVLLYLDPIWQITEKVTATRHCNSVDIWIIIHEMGSTNFRSYLLTASGVNPVAVVSSVGAGPGLAACSVCWGGQMKVSPNGRKVAASHPNLAVELLDFDPSTGILSNPLVLTALGGYGCEFSPDGSKLYYNYGATLIQWDLCAGSNAAIIASQNTITVAPAAFGALQLAPDGKIYTTVGLGFQAFGLGAINDPNLSGVACNYVYPAINTTPYLCNIGLPGFMNDFFLPKPGPFAVTQNPTASCQSATFTPPGNITIGGTCNSSSLLYNGMTWHFGDPNSGPSNTSSLPNPIHHFSSAGTYTVKLILHRTCGSDTLHETVTIASTVSVSAIGSPANCNAGGSATVNVIGGGEPYNFTWQPSGNTGATTNGLSAGVYSVLISSPGICANTATVLIGLQNTMTGTVIPSTVACAGGGSTGAAAVSVSGAAGPFTYAWSGNSQTGSSVIGFPSGSHTVTAMGAVPGCSVTLSFQINNSIGTATIATLPSGSACENTTFNLPSSSGDGTYSWTGPGGFTSTQQTPVLQPVSAGMAGVYTVTAVNANYCTVTSTLALDVFPVPKTFLLSSKSNLCAPYCTQLKAIVDTSGPAITKTVFMMDNTILSNQNPEHCFTTPGEHLLSLSCENEKGCKSSAALSIKAFPKPTADFEFYPLEPVAGMDEVVFTNVSSNDQTFSYWYLAGENKSGGTAKNISRIFENAGKQVMALVVHNGWGCADTILKPVNISEDFCFYIPDAFTPNEDGKNDEFSPKGYGILSMDMKIFDRWGELVFSSNDPKASWNGFYKGVLCKQDLYAWKINVKGINGKARDLAGHVSLVR